MRETGPEKVWGRFGGLIWIISGKGGKCSDIDQKWLENMELDGVWVVVAPFGLGLAVVRGIGPKFPYGPLFWPVRAPGAQ